VKTIWELLKETFTEWQEDKASRLAAALSYYTVFSLAPLVIIILAIIGLLYRREEASSYLINEIQKLVGQSGAEVVQSIVENASQPNTSLVATIIGIGTLLLGASGVFGQLQDALNTIWGVAPKPGRSWLGMVTDRLLSMAMVVGIGFLLLVSLVVSATLTAATTYLSDYLPPSAGVVGRLLDFIISMVVITILFAAIYKVLPDVKIKWRDVWIGAICSVFTLAGRVSIRLMAPPVQSWCSSCGSTTQPRFCCLAQSLPKFIPKNLVLTLCPIRTRCS
jgi:membrane protein